MRPSFDTFKIVRCPRCHQDIIAEVYCENSEEEPCFDLTYPPSEDFLKSIRDRFEVKKNIILDYYNEKKGSRYFMLKHLMTLQAFVDTVEKMYQEFQTCKEQR